MKTLLRTMLLAAAIAAVPALSSCALLSTPQPPKLQGIETKYTPDTDAASPVTTTAPVSVLEETGDPGEEREVVEPDIRDEAEDEGPEDGQETGDD